MFDNHVLYHPCIAKGSPTKVKEPDKNDTTVGADSLATWRSSYKKQYILWMCAGSKVTILKTSVQNCKHVEDWNVTLVKV